MCILGFSEQYVNINLLGLELADYLADNKIIS